MRCPLLNIKFKFKPLQRVCSLNIGPMCEDKSLVVMDWQLTQLMCFISTMWVWCDHTWLATWANTPSNIATFWLVHRDPWLWSTDYFACFPCMSHCLMFVKCHSLCLLYVSNAFFCFLVSVVRLTHALQPLTIKGYLAHHHNFIPTGQKQNTSHLSFRVNQHFCLTYGSCLVSSDHISWSSRVDDTRSDLVVLFC